MKKIILLLFAFINILNANSIVTVCNTDIEMGKSQRLHWEKLDKNKSFIQYNDKKCLAISAKRGRIFSIIEKKIKTVDMPEDINTSNFNLIKIIYRNRVGVFKLKKIKKESVFHIFYKKHYKEITKLMIFYKKSDYLLTEEYKCKKISKDCQRMNVYRYMKAKNKNNW